MPLLSEQQILSQIVSGEMSVIANPHMCSGMEIEVVNVKTDQVTIAEASSARLYLEVHNPHESLTLWIGGDTVAVGNGIRILPGQNRIIQTCLTGVLWKAICEDSIEATIIRGIM